MSPRVSDRIGLDSVRALDALLDDLADRVAERLRSQEGGSRPRYADGKSNPLGSRRAFLDAHRRGEFPTFRRGREIIALWVDVERYIESRRSVRRMKADETDEDCALMEKAGIQLQPAKGAAVSGRGKRAPQRHG